MLYFITGNKNKFKEAQAILGSDAIEQLEIDLHELQEIDPHKIIRHKLQEAFKHHPWPFIVEDSSLSMECLWWSLPWPLIKWFLQEIKNEWLYALAKNSNKYKAKASVLVGYASNINNIKIFEWSIEWSIVSPVSTNFWRDGIFQPIGHDVPYGLMDKEDKNKISHRRIALDKLKEFLKNDEK